VIARPHRATSAIYATSRGPSAPSPRPSRVDRPDQHPERAVGTLIIARRSQHADVVEIAGAGVSASGLRDAIITIGAVAAQRIVDELDAALLPTLSGITMSGNGTCRGSGIRRRARAAQPGPESSPRADRRRGRRPRSRAPARVFASRRRPGSPIWAGGRVTRLDRHCPCGAAGGRQRQLERAAFRPRYCALASSPGRRSEVDHTAERATLDLDLLIDLVLLGGRRALAGEISLRP